MRTCWYSCILCCVSIFCAAVHAISSRGAVPLQPDLQQSRLDDALTPFAARTFSAEGLMQLLMQSRQCFPQPRETRLVFVTPWNSVGYNYTSLHSARISHVAPVWYRVKVHGSAVTLDGAQDVYHEWLDSLHESTKVVPRFEVQFASRQEVENVLFFPKAEIESMVQSIVREVSRCKYDGATLEVPYVAQMSTFVKQLGMALHAQGKLLILVIPAHHDMADTTPFAHSDMVKVSEYVDHFSLNAYDHAAAVGGSGTGNAPLPWLRQILDELLTAADEDDDEEDPFSDAVSPQDADSQLPLAEKVLLGLNFYGFTMTLDNVLNTITATEYLGLVQFSAFSIPLEVAWDEEQGEHKMDGKIWTIWYPSVLSLLFRTQLAQEYGIGISIWEGGQGLEHFWDVVL